MGRQSVVVVLSISAWLTVQLQIGLMSHGLAIACPYWRSVVCRGAVACCRSSHAHHAGAGDAGCDNFLLRFIFSDPFPYESLSLCLWETWAPDSVGDAFISGLWPSAPDEVVILKINCPRLSSAWHYVNTPGEEFYDAFNITHFV